MSEAAPDIATPVAAKKWPVRVGLALATLVYLAYSSFGIAAPFWWGHHGYHGATYMLRARMSLRLHMLTPATWTGFDQPPANALYFHHPIAYHHFLTVLVPIFGEHEWLARGVAVVGGLFALWALYALVKRAWSRELALCAVVVYVFLPVLTSYSILSDAMLPAFACVAWALNAYLQILEKPSRRALIHAALAYGICGLMMWESYFIAPFIALHALAYRFTARGKTLRLGNWNALDLHTLVTGAVCVATMTFHIWFTHHAGAWQEFLASYQLRHTPPSVQYVLDRHTQWIQILFGMPLVVIGMLWLVVWIARLITGRARRRDLAVLTFLYVNTIYIYMFAEGSSVHLYRVFFYSGFFTLATVDLISDAAAAAAKLSRGNRARAKLLAGVTLMALYLGTEAPHAWANLIESRVLMGTHGQPGYNPEQEKLAFGAEVTRLTAPTDRVIVQYRQLGSRKEFWYYLDRSIDEVGSLLEMTHFSPAQKAHSVVIADERQLVGAERAFFDGLIREHPVTFFGRFVMVDLRSNKPEARSFAFVPGKMSFMYRWLISHKYPPLHLERAPYLMGLCDAVELGVPIARDEPLPAAPADPKLQACFRNYLIARGETAAASAALAKITAGLTPSSARLGGGAQIIGVSVAAGRLRLALLAGGPETGELRYAIKREKFPPVYVPRSDSLPAPADWRAGLLYLDEVALPANVGPSEIAAELWKYDEAPPPPPVPAYVPVAKPGVVPPGVKANVAPALLKPGAPVIVKPGAPVAAPPAAVKPGNPIAKPGAPPHPSFALKPAPPPRTTKVLSQTSLGNFPPR